MNYRFIEVRVDAVVAKSHSIIDWSWYNPSSLTFIEALPLKYWNKVFLITSPFTPSTLSAMFVVLIWWSISTNTELWRLLQDSGVKVG